MTSVTHLELGPSGWNAVFRAKPGDNLNAAHGVGAKGFHAHRKRLVASGEASRVLSSVHPFNSVLRFVPIQLPEEREAHAARAIAVSTGGPSRAVATMSGNATFAGTNYQGRVIAFVYAHVLAEARLGWLDRVDDTPLAVWGETGGPGDDIRIEFGGSCMPIEVQAKHGLTAGVKLDEVLERVSAADSRHKDTRVVVAVNRGSSRKLYIDFARDLERLRGGRGDGLAPETAALRTRLGARSIVLDRLYLIPIDVDEAYEPEWKGVIQLLKQVLEDPEKATTAGEVLFADASMLCSKKLRRTRKELVELLGAANIRVNSPAKEERWNRELDFILKLLRHRRPDAGLDLLDQLEQALSGLKVDPTVRYRLFQQKAAALYQLERPRESLTYAERALDIKGDGTQAMRWAALASLMIGDEQSARRYSKRALETDPTDAHSWIVASKIAAALNDPPLVPPGTVTASVPYRVFLADTAASRGDWPDVLAITAGVFASGERDTDAVFLRTLALSNLIEIAPAQAVERAGEVERLATELLDRLTDTHPQSIKALLCRATARRRLGRTAEAESDVTLANARATDDPDAIRHRATTLRATDLDAAIALLRHPVIQTDPQGLVLRARFLAERGLHSEARKDLAAVFAGFDATQASEGLCFAAADAAIILRDVGLAEAALARTPKKLDDPLYRKVVSARISFVKGDVDSGVAEFDDVIATDKPRSKDLQLELAIRLVRAKRCKESAATFKLLGLSDIPSDVLGDYAVALLGANELTEAKALVEHVRALSSPMPDWAVRLATHLALIQEDPDAAIANLTALLARGGTIEAAVHISLATALVDTDRQAEAAVHLDALAARKDLAAEEEVRLAYLLRASGRAREALDVAFHVWRRNAQDPLVHRALVGVALSSASAFQSVEEVAEGTSVQIRTDQGEKRRYMIVGAGEVDPLRNEMAVDDAKALGLLGKRVGDVITRSAGGWVIEEVVPAVIHGVRDAMEHFSDRFPRQPFFVQGFSIGDLTSIRDFVPFIASAHARKRQREVVFDVYRNNTLPLGFVAQCLGESIPEVMLALMADSDDGAPCLLVEWYDQEGQAESASAAFDAREIVVTRSSLQTAFDLDLLGVIKDTFSVVVPRTLHRELRMELRDADEAVARGRTVFGLGPAGLAFQEAPPGSGVLVENANRLRRQLGWISTVARIESRPLAGISANESDSESLRNLIGFSSADAVDLVRYLPATLFADDLGLRRLFPKGSGRRSFSVVGLLSALAARGAISGPERTHLSLKLVEKRLCAVPLSGQLLLGALREYGEFAKPKLRRVFCLLGGPSATLLNSAKVLADVVKSLAIAPVQVIPVESLVDLGLDGMARSWPPMVCAQAFARFIAQGLLLLPQTVREAERAASAFVQRRLTLSVPHGEHIPLSGLAGFGLDPM